jgi:hypothetical protein
MAAQATFSRKRRRRAGRFMLLPLALLIGLLAAGGFVAYVLWPTWPSAPVALDAPPLPVTVAGVLFEVPPAAIRAAVQRHPGPHERIDLAFLWPSLTPPLADGKNESTPLNPIEGDNSGPSPKSEAADAHGSLFVTVAALGSLLPPAERLRSIYPHYVEAETAVGADGLAILPFRAGTPYEGEDLVYFAENADRFYARCTRRSGIVPGTCIQERALGDADITLRFPRDWLDDWKNVAAGFDRLIAQLHPQGK